MSASQRRKGKSGELEVVNILRDTLGLPTLTRNHFERDDIKLAKQGGGHFRIEVKRRNTLSCEPFLDQALMACKAGDVALVVMRADGGRWMVLTYLDDYLPLLGGEIAKEYSRDVV